MLNLSPATLISRILTLVIALTFHEFSHAATANYFGDDTPRNNGRLTLNPLAHLDVIGSLMLIIAGFGWAKPVPVNPYTLQRKSPSALMWVSLAGPLSNLLLAILAAIPLRFHLISYSYNPSSIFPTPYSFLVEFLVINLLLMLFNLIPLAPLDGDKIVDYFFPPQISNFFEKIRPYGPIILLIVAFVLPQLGFDVLGWIITPALQGMIKILIGGAA
jgi:Zn-dependent protease